MSSTQLLEDIMSLDLPEILRRYFDAQNAHDIDAMVACFAPNAVVRDEGHTHVGAEAVRSWKQDTSAKYRITATPIESRTDGDRTIVVARVAGTFKGSPVNLTYRFGFSPEGRIGALEAG
jgi:hypothetical protein